MRYVEIYNLNIYDFEVAGIQLNGYDNIQLYNMDIGPSLTSVPVVGRYSQARFGLLSYLHLKKSNNKDEEIDFTDRDDTLTVEEIITNLETGMDLFFDWKMSDTTQSWNYKLLRAMEDNQKIFESARYI